MFSFLREGSRYFWVKKKGLNLCTKDDEERKRDHSLMIRNISFDITQKKMIITKKDEVKNLIIREMNMQ